MVQPGRQASDDVASSGESAQDALLVERVLRGDNEAYGGLVSRHMRRAFSIAYRLVEHREDAEDIVQDSFLRALERIGTLDPARPFRPWFLRIVVNQALNARRARSLRATEQIPVSMASTTASPVQAAENALLGERLRTALESLPERQRTIVQLADLEELNSSEIAEILDISAGTVRWHLHQARQELRNVLEPLKENQ
jgi:RNA polymerase sigma-70 factor, ECF subfamily